MGATLLAAAIMVGLGSGGASGVAHSATASGPGWLGSRSASAPQDGVATVSLPSAFAHANLLVALVAADGPDSVPIGAATTETTVRFSDPARLLWTRAAHVSARHDFGYPGQALEHFGASVTEVWTATPPPRWVPSRDPLRVTNSHPNRRDDGFVVTIAAFTNGRLAEAATLDGMANDTEQISLSVPDESAIYAATFAGHRNTDFVPLAGYHLVRQRRAGDDTGGVIASDTRDLSAGVQRLGYTAPSPGDFWELAVAVVSTAS